MTTNHTDNDIETVASALEGWASWPARKKMAEEILTALDAAGRIAPPWEPCELHDMKKGDRYRVEWSSGSVTDGVATDDFSEAATPGFRWFRIPAPTPAVEWPEEPGPYLVTWKRYGEHFGPTWFVSDGETLWGTDKTFLHPESTEGDLKLLSVEKGVVAE